MGCICSNLIFVLTSFLRLVGAFPYRWRRGKKKKNTNKGRDGGGGGGRGRDGGNEDGGKLELYRSVIAVAWSWVIVMGLVTFSLSCVINAPRRRSGVTSTITIHILNYVSYLTSAVLFSYLSLSSVKLAQILGRLQEAGVSLRKSSLVQRGDAMELVCGVGMVFGIAFATYFSISDVIIQPVTKSIALYQIPAMFLDFSIETTASSVSLLIYLLLKLVSIEMREAVETLVMAPFPDGHHTPSLSTTSAKDAAPKSALSSLRWGTLTHHHPRPITPTADATLQVWLSSIPQWHKSLSLSLILRPSVFVISSPCGQ